MSFTLIPRTRVIFRWATQASRSAVAHNAFASLISRSSTASPARATLAALQRCGYATATATKRATKPRATAAKRTATTGRKTASGKTVAKRAPAKKTKTAAKKSVAKKPVRKAKKVAKKPVKPKKKVLTERQKELLAKKKLRDEVAELKVKALTPPEKLPDTNMSLYVKEHVNGTNDFKKAAQQYKDLPEHQVQVCSCRVSRISTSLIFPFVFVFFFIFAPPLSNSSTAAELFFLNRIFLVAPQLTSGPTPKPTRDGLKH